MMVPFCVHILFLPVPPKCRFLACQWIETGSAWSTLLILPVAFRPDDHIRDIERPHDLETLEHGKDIVVELEFLPVRLPGEIATMCIEPPLSRAVALPLIPGERVINLGQRLNRYLGRSPDEPRTPFPVQHHDEIAGFRYRFATLAVITCQAGSRPLDPGYDQIGQFGRHLGGIAECCDRIIVVIKAGMAVKCLPECINLRGSRR